MKIAIAQVLASIKDGEEFSIHFIRSTGKGRGTTKKLYKGIGGYAYEAFKQKRPLANILKVNDHKIGRHKLNGTIPVVDISDKAHQQLTILISHIIQFNGKKVIH